MQAKCTFNDQFVKRIAANSEASNKVGTMAPASACFLCGTYCMTKLYFDVHKSRWPQQPLVW